MKSCRHCGQVIPLDVLEKKDSERIMNLKAALQRAKAKGIHIGRPSTVDYASAQRLRASGHSYRAIAKILGCSCDSAFRACKKMKVRSGGM